MPLASGFSHIATLTDDLDRLIGFYERVFDASVMFDAEEEGLRHAMLDIGGGTPLHAFHVPWVAPDARREMFERGRIDHYGIFVPDVASLLEVQRRLEAEGDGVTDSAVRDFGGVYSLHFVDPDGVHLEVNLLKDEWDDVKLRPRDEWTIVELAGTSSAVGC